ncbi:hypothetical protein CBR_g241 [Chara braunii]|uniref:VPS9 domain-containing protein n=1 Tax=Chara braunii TaxID=69332 RepID=A0A388JM47_CHABU|nr:hypothetical protein CBR_g241 [Chara braunii]|eukprot:GBG58841.1 hypothetical protein CBR_g241 [Chara braunii]
MGQQQQSDSGGEMAATANAPMTFQDFLDRMRHPSAADLVKSMKSFMLNFTGICEGQDPERNSAIVQEFLASTEAAFRAHPLWAGASEEELEGAGEGLEKYLMTKLFKHAFAPTDEERERDLKLSQTIKKLQRFIRPEHLDIPQSAQKESSWAFAQKELQKINSWKAPRDKLVCILNCCRVINNLLMVVSLANDTNPPGADDFLPVLIYIVIKANPPQLQSNLLYIQRYRNQNRLVSEASYFYTNLLSAVSFIESLGPKSLNINPAEFEQFMSEEDEMSGGSGIQPSRQESIESHASTVTTEYTLASPSDSGEQGSGRNSTVGRSSSPPPSSNSSAHPCHSPREDSGVSGDESNPPPSLRISSPPPMSIPSAPVPGMTAATTVATVSSRKSPVSSSAAAASSPSKFVMSDARTPSPISGNSPRTGSGNGMGGSSSMSPRGVQKRGGVDTVKVVDEGLRSGFLHPFKRLIPSDLEASAMDSVVEAAELGQLGRDYRFLYASSGDLTVGQVEDLLQDYKEMVLKYEALSRALECHDRQRMAMGRFGRELEMTVDAMMMAGAPRSADLQHTTRDRSLGELSTVDDAWRDAAGEREGTAVAMECAETPLTMRGLGTEVVMPTAGGRASSEVLPPGLMSENSMISGKDGWRQGPWRINPLAFEVHLVV